MVVRVLFILYCIEAGVFFILAPWTRFWMLSPVLHRIEMVGLVVDNNFFRGFVSGFGIVHLVLGASELGRILSARAQKRITK